MDDSDIATAIYLAKKLHIQIHIRGSDSHPVVELTDKYSGRVIGGIELKKRIERLRAQENQDDR